jgi:hypothetical protein
MEAGQAAKTNLDLTMIAENMIDIPVLLGLVPPPKPLPKTVHELFSNRQHRPPMLIDGLLHQGCKMLLGGTSKSNKTWSLVDLALSVASGVPWWGLKTTPARVLYLNFELPEWALTERIEAIARAKPEIPDIRHNVQFWTLRGHATDMTAIRPFLQRSIEGEGFGLIIIDPAYKLLGDRDENSNGDVGSFMNEFERFAENTGAAVAIAHHFAKGDSSVKDPIDRMAGAGAWARDPDTILVMTPHEEENCFTVSSILRCLPQMPEFVLEWHYPLMKRASDLDPSSLRRRGGKPKALTDREFIQQCLSTEPQSPKRISAKAAEFSIGSRTVERYLQRLAASGVIRSAQGCYWRDADVSDTPTFP